MNRPVSWLSRPALAPFAIPIFVATPLWQRNHLRLPYEDILPSVGVLLLLVGLLVVLIYALTRNWRRTALLATIWTAFLLYAHGDDRAPDKVRLGVDRSTKYKVQSPK